MSQPTEQDDTDKRKARLSQLCSQLNTIMKEQQVESESDEYEDDRSTADDDNLQNRNAADALRWTFQHDGGHGFAKGAVRPCG